jgi:hypothetical protein
MPVELSEILKNTYGMTFASRGINTIFYSKMYTTIILTIIILIIITIIYPCKKGTPFWIVGKTGLYIFISILTVICIHDGVVYSTFNTKSISKSSDEFVEELVDVDSNTAYNQDKITITPTIGGSDANVNNTREPPQAAKNSDELFRMFGV